MLKRALQLEGDSQPESTHVDVSGALKKEMDANLQQDACVKERNGKTQDTLVT